MVCAECGRVVSLDSGYAEYQYGIDQDGKSMRYQLCLPCDAREDEPDEDDE